MLKFDKAFIKIDGEIIELPWGQTQSSAGNVQYWQGIYNADSAMPTGSTLELPAGVYNPSADLLSINQEGFILIPNAQYTESNGTITFTIDIPENTQLVITILKLHSKFDPNETNLDPDHPGLIKGGQIITTVNGNKLWRHYIDDSCVLQCPNILGGIHLRIRDAQYRSAEIWKEDATSTGILPLLSTPNDPNTAKYNTDKLITLSDTPAAHYCRSMGFDLPTCNEIFEIWKNRLEIDSIDKTINLYNNNKLTTWKFTGSTYEYCWSSSEFDKTRSYAISSSGGNPGSTKTLKYGVIPVLEI